jgi:PAS domain S-box-containing protein
MRMPFYDPDYDLFKDFPEPVFVMAPDGTILAANHFFSSKFESLHKNIHGCNVFELLVQINAPPEIITNCKNKTGEVLRIGRHLAFDDIIDDQIWRSSIYPVFSPEGFIEKLLIFVQNVTEQRHAETEQAMFQERMNYALQSSHVSVWSLDLEKNQVMRTCEHDRIFGYDSLLPHWGVETFFDHLYPEDVPMVTKSYEASMANRSDFNLECRIRRADGVIRWINLAGTYRFSKPESSRYVVGIVADITEKKAAALELEKLQQRLQQSQKMELLGQLAGGIAHDFNNTLTAIIGNIELAIARLDPSLPAIRNLRDAHTAALRSANLTRQLLGFARKQMTTPKALSLNRETEHLIPMLRPLFSSQIECVWQPGSGDPSVFIDPGQLDQMLTNLCINARDAIEKSGTITISTGIVNIEKEECAKGNPCRKPGTYAVLSVSDTGCGIDSSTLPHIFEPFFTTKPPGKGTGLGLSNLYGIVSQNNCFIDCQTEPGKGSTFAIYFPLHQPSIKKFLKETIRQKTGMVTGTVLLVEDEPNILSILRLSLTEKGYTVLEAPDAEQAISLAASHPDMIDLLVADVVLPRMNGIELGQQLLSRYPQLKTLFMSGFTFDTTAKSLVSSAPLNFISKPFAIQDFIDRVSQSLQ